MKLILSRKGFDSVAGGGPSPILLDGRMLSLPIPEPTTRSGATRYGDIVDLDGTDYLQILHTLGYGAYDDRSTCHLDPDLVPTVRPRGDGWRGMLGQAEAAASHLSNQGVGEGDLFLFWGLYAPADPRARFTRQPRHHALFGYLEVDRVVDVGAGGTLPEAPYHPHLTRSYGNRRNLVFVAPERLSHDPRRPGWGVFQWSPGLVLSDPGSKTLTSWRLPACFGPSSGTTLSYHGRPEQWTGPNADGHVSVVRRGQGQEFVCEASSDILDWALGLITGTPIWAPTT